MSAMDFREPNEVLWRGVRPAHKGTQVVKNNAASNGVVIVHTVTAGKTFFLTAWTFIAEASGTGNSARFYVRNVDDAIQYYIDVVVFQAVGQVVDGVGLKYPVEIPAGWDIVVDTNNVNTTARAWIHGWEE